MMDHNSELKLEAFLDGELAEAEAREVAVWIAQDQDAAALLAELRNTRQDLSRHEQLVQLPESREFFWSKIEKEIERQEGTESTPVMAQDLPWWHGLRRILVPLGGVAGLVLAGLFAGGFIGAAKAQMETTAADSAAFTYHDYEKGTTLVWLSYPAENEFADSDSPATIVQ